MLFGNAKYRTNTTYRLLGRCACKWVPFNWSRDRDLGLARRAFDATLCAAWAACIAVPAYEARDRRSEAAANDCRD